MILTSQLSIDCFLSLETVELCPHVYKHVFAIVSLILSTCYKKQGRELLKQEGAIKTFALKIFRKLEIPDSLDLCVNQVGRHGDSI